MTYKYRKTHLSCIMQRKFIRFLVCGQVSNGLRRRVNSLKRMRSHSFRSCNLIGSLSGVCAYVTCAVRANYSVHECLQRAAAVRKFTRYANTRYALSWTIVKRFAFNVRSAQLESEKHSRATRIARRYKFILCLSCKFIFNMLRIYERRFQRL